MGTETAGLVDSSQPRSSPPRSMQRGHSSPGTKTLRGTPQRSHVGCGSIPLAGFFEARDYPTGGPKAKPFADASALDHVLHCLPKRRGEFNWNRAMATSRVRLVLYRPILPGVCT